MEKKAKVKVKEKDDLPRAIALMLLFIGAAIGFKSAEIFLVVIFTVMFTLALEDKENSSFQKITLGVVSFILLILPRFL